MIFQQAFPLYGLVHTQGAFDDGVHGRGCSRVDSLNCELCRIQRGRSLRTARYSEAEGTRFNETDVPLLGVLATWKGPFEVLCTSSSWDLALVLGR